MLSSSNPYSWNKLALPSVEASSHENFQYSSKKKVPLRKRTKQKRGEGPSFENILKQFLQKKH